jgi:hypothetical protein
LWGHIFIIDISTEIAWKRRSAEKVRSREFDGGVAWKRIVDAVEAVHGGRWEKFRDDLGDWGRDAALYLGRHPDEVWRRGIDAVNAGLSKMKM